MRRSRLACGLTFLFLCASLARAQGAGDFCSVTLIDTEQMKHTMAEFRTAEGDEQHWLELGEKISQLTRVLGAFRTTVGEEIVTAKTFRIPGSDSYAHTSVVYTNEFLATKTTDLTVRLALAVSGDENAEEAFATNSLNSTSVTIKDHDFMVSLAGYFTAEGRRLSLGMQCCGEESGMIEACQKGIEPEAEK